MAVKVLLLVSEGKIYGRRHKVAQNEPRGLPIDL